MTPSTILWTLALIALAIGGTAQFLTLRRLRRVHPETWTRLGEPTFFFNMSIQNQGRLMGFVWGDAHRRLDDRTLHRQVVVLRIATVLTAVLIVAAWIAG